MKNVPIRLKNGANRNMLKNLNLQLRQKKRSLLIYFYQNITISHEIIIQVNYLYININHLNIVLNLGFHNLKILHMNYHMHVSHLVLNLILLHGWMKNLGVLKT